MAVRPPAGAPVPMTPYADLELSVEPDDDEPDSGMVLVYLVLAAAIVALGVGMWVVTR